MILTTGNNCNLAASHLILYSCKYPTKIAPANAAGLACGPMISKRNSHVKNK